MTNYVLRRLGATVVVMICVSFIAFALLRLAPGDPVRLYLPESATPEEVEALRESMGLNESFWVQYAKYIVGVFQGDLGISMQYNQPCSKIIFGRLASTLELALAGGIISVILCIPLGIISGVKQGSLVDLGAMSFALIFQSMSNVWLGVFLILVCSVNHNWLPSMGYGGIKHLIMPALTIGLPMAAQTTRMARSGMIDVLREDYITATYARGISSLKIYSKYAFKNAVIPVITLIAINVAGYLGGAIVSEQIFSWPGLGALTQAAISNRDYPLVQSILLVVSALIALVMLVIDIVNSFIDRRVTLN